MSYAEFLASKRRIWTGLGVEANGLPRELYAWQTAIVRWALRKGRAAIFADCGLGKTFMQVAWAQALHVPTLILAPLCVAEQTVEEAAKLGVAIRYARTQAEATTTIAITNYERLERFSPQAFQAVVLDESSILKAFDGKTRTKLIEAFGHTIYRLCCTATPSPNDISELANHAEFLGLMTRPEFLATWFIRVGEGHRTTTHHGWRMKRHAVAPFYRWLASWAVALRHPSDLGYADEGFALPPLRIRDYTIVSDGPIGTVLFPEMGLKGLEGRLSARRGSLEARTAAAAALVDGPGSWLLWCGLNAEQDAIGRLLTKAGVAFASVEGKTPYHEKVASIRAWEAGDRRVMVTKPDVLGFGMNFQHCAQMAFVGLSDSYETYYQAIRRCWRYGQRQPVDAWIVVSEAERLIVENVRQKELRADDLSRNLLEHMREFEREELAI